MVDKGSATVVRWPSERLRAPAGRAKGTTRLQRQRSRRSRAAALGLALIVIAGASSAGDTPPPKVGLDQLLKLPTTTPVVAEARKGGHTRPEWRARFDTAQEDLADHELALRKAREELEELVGEQSNWQMTAPGLPAGSAENTPVSFQLREEIRREEAEVDRAERRLRDLDVEASLAGVPADWLVAHKESPVPPR